MSGESFFSSDPIELINLLSADDLPLADVWLSYPIRAFDIIRFTPLTNYSAMLQLFAKPNCEASGASVFFCATSPFPRIDKVAQKARHPFYADLANFFVLTIATSFARKQHSLQFNFGALLRHYWTKAFWITQAVMIAALFLSARTLICPDDPGVTKAKVTRGFSAVVTPELAGTPTQALLSVRQQIASVAKRLNFSALLGQGGLGLKSLMLSVGPAPCSASLCSFSSEEEAPFILETDNASLPNFSLVEFPSSMSEVESGNVPEGHITLNLERCRHHVYLRTIAQGDEPITNTSVAVVMWAAACSQYLELPTLCTFIRYMMTESVQLMGATTIGHDDYLQ
eukprot:s3328_g9.t1